jgi:putative Mn2+ efflux pump MntP
LWQSLGKSDVKTNRVAARMSILPLILALSVTIDNVVIGQATTLSPRKVAVMSAAIHLSLLMIGTGFAPILSNLLPDLVRWLSPALFACWAF